MNKLMTIIDNNKLYKHYYNHYLKSPCKQSYSKIRQVCNQSKVKVCRWIPKGWIQTLGLYDNPIVQKAL